MRFREWISQFQWQFDEFHRFEDIPTDHIELKIPADFDENEALEKCVEEASDLDIGHSGEDVYANPEDDPEFDEISPKEWLSQNPKPKASNFEDDEDLTSAEEDWQNDYEAVEYDYEVAVRRWKEEMEERAERNEELEIEAQSEWISECVRNKKYAHENDDLGIKFNFNHNQQPFEVEFTKTTTRFGTDIDDIYRITFSGPNETSTTNNFEGASAIYNQVLGSIKKLTEVKNVNGFEFAPAEPAMALVYNRFFQRYGSGFVMVNPGIFLRKDIVESMMKKAGPTTQIQWQKNINHASQEAGKYLDQVKQDKMQMKSLIGKMVGLLDPYSGTAFPAVVLGFAAGRVDTPIVASLISGELTKTPVEMDRIRTSYRPQSQEAHKLWHLMHQTYPTLMQTFKPPQKSDMSTRPLPIPS